jgi:hypothetical protein
MLGGYLEWRGVNYVRGLTYIVPPGGPDGTFIERENNK